MIRGGIALTLISLMVFAFSGYLGVFKLRQNQIRKEVKTTIKEGAPDSLKFNFYLDEIESDPNQITWMHSKEFRFQGDMYDILSRTEKNGRILLHCVKDVKESGLFAELDRVVNLKMNGDPQQKNQKLQWQKLFQSLFKNSDALNETRSFPTVTEHNTPYLRNLTDRNAPPRTPPPRPMA